MNDDILKLYNALQKDGYNNLGTSDEFGNKLQDENNRRKLYDSLVRDGYNDLGSFEEFSGRLVRPMGDQTQAVRMQPEAQQVPEVPVQKDSVNPVVQQAVPEEDVTLNFDDEPNGLKKDDSIRGFFPALAQGAKNMYYGTVNLLGEAAQSFSGRNVFNPLSWGSRNAQEALDELDRRVAEGLGPNERYADPESVAMRERIMMDPNLSDKEKRRELIKNSVGSAAYEEYAKSVEKQAGGYMKGIERLQHNSDIDKMISTALDRAGGNVDEARRILQEKAEDLSLGDRMMNYASEGLAQSKETKGFGAWLGQQIPMLLPSAAAIGLSAVTKNPKYAEWIGKGSFGLMAASSAGETMNRAREYGATDNEVWSAGLTDAAIMYAAGKIPFNRYTGRLFNTAKSQAAKNLSAALADENSLAAKEAEELFNRASKELGMKFNFRTYLGDIAAHGATMSAMSTMQTMVPMIYEHPEDYPTLTNILESSLAGFRDGVFLGATLGAASQGMQIRNNRARWKNQGGIMFAEMESDGGEPVMVEVVGIDGRAIRRPRDWWNQKTDEFVKVDRQGKAPLAGEGDVEAFDAGEGGTVEVLVDGKLESMDKAEFRKRLRSLGRKTFAQVEEAEVQYQTDNAFEEGYDIHEPSERHDAQNMYEYQRQLLKEKTGLDDISEENVMFYYENENWTPEQKETVLDYLKAKAARRGMIEGIRDDISRKIIAATTAIDDNTSKTDNLVHPATLKDDRRVYVVDGNIVMLEDGTGVDKSRSMHDLLVRDAETGELFFAPVEDFLSVDDAIDPLLEKQTVAEQLRNGIAQEASDQIDGIVTFNPGDEYILLTDEGHEVPVKVVPNENGVVDNGDGTVNVVLNNAAVDGSPVITPMPKDQIQSLVNAYNLKRLGNYIDHLQEMRDQFGKAVAAPADANAPAAIENAPAPAAPAEPTETEQPVIPVDAQGRKQYMQAPTQATYEDIYSDEDFDNDEEAYGFIAGKVKRTSEALKKSQAAVDKIKPENYDSPAEYRAAKNKALEAHKPFQDAYDYWKGVKDLADADIAEAKKRADRAARLEEQALQEPMSLEEVVANGFRGMEHALDKEDFKRETGMSEAELKRFFPFWAKKGQGMSLQGLAESIAADDQSGLVPRMGDADQADTQAVRDAIINVFRSATRPTDIYDYTRKANIARKEQMEREAANAAENARLEAEKTEPVVEVPAEAAVKEEPAGTEVPEPEVPADVSPSGPDAAVSSRIADILSGKDKKNYSDAMYNHKPGVEYPDKYYDEVVRQWNEYKKGISEQRDALQKRVSEIVDATTRAAEKEYLDYKNRKGERVDEVGLHNATIDILDRELKKNQEYKDLTSKIDALDKLVSPEAKDKFRRNAIGMLYTDFAEEAPAAPEQTEVTPTQQAIADAEAEVNTEPTEAQKEAGNYKMGHVTVDGFDISIENPKGSVRRGTSPDGKAWETKMNNTYGYLRRTEGVDGDHIDVFLSDNPEQGNIFVVDQVDPKTGQFDEHKVMYGFNSLDEAKAAYLSNYEEGWQGLGNITEVTRDEFKKWVDSSHRKTKPFAEYKSVKPVEQAPEESSERLPDVQFKKSEAPVPEGTSAMQRNRLFEWGQVAIREAAYNHLLTNNEFGRTWGYDEFAEAYKEQAGDMLYAKDEPFLKQYYDYFKSKLDAAVDAYLETLSKKPYKPAEPAPVELNDENYRKAFKTVKNLQEATDDELKSALDFFKASQADNTSKAEALKAKPDYNEKGFDGLSVKGFNEAAKNDAKKVLDLENEIRRRNGEAPVEAAPEEPAAVEPAQGTIDFGQPAEEPVAPKTEVKLPATLRGAKEAVDKAIAAPDGKGYKLPEAIYVKNAITEMDVNARELMNAETTKDTRDGILPYVKNYIDKLAEDYAKKLEKYGSPENVVKAVNDNIGALKKKVEDGKVLPEDFEQEAKKAIEPLVMLIRKMRYDKPSTVRGRNYEWEHADESGFREDVANLLRGASDDVLARLEVGLGLNLPRTVEGLVRNVREKARSSAEAQQYRQMYFDAHPEMPSAEPKGKFDIWKFIKKDEQRPAMNGIFHDKGYKVASDSHILVAVKDAYPKENEGKIIDKKKNVIDAKYPKWRELLQKGEDSGIDAKHLASFVAGVKELEGKNFKDAKIIVPIGGEMRAFNAEGLENFLRAVDEIGGKITFKPLGSSGKSLMLQAEGKKGYALAMNTMPSNWTSPMFHWYATPAELEQMAKQREQDRTVAEATSLVTGRPVEEIESEKKPAPKPRTPQEKWDAAEEALAKAVTAEDRSAAMSLRTEALQDKLSTVADEKHPAHVVNYDNVLDQLAKDGLDADVIEEVREGLELENPNRDTNRSFYIPFDNRGIYIIADEIKSLEDGVSAYVHERQHDITLAGALDEKLAKLPGFDRKVIWNAMRKWKAGNWYERKDDVTLADEFISMAMDLAYKCDTPEVFENELRKAGIDNEEIITFVKTLDNEQRNSEPLSSARQVTLFQDSEQGGGVENGGDTGQLSGGNLGSEGNRPAQSGKESPARRSGGEIKTGPNRQIEDFGEKIAGARKDELRSLSKTLEDATEESFVALPLAKAFKRPNTKKLVENGVISPEDACLVDAVSWLILGSPKPVKLKDRSWKSKRRDQEIVDWARQQAQRARVVLDYLNADAEGKQAIIDNLANVPHEVKVAADAHRNQILEWNRDRGIQIGELYPLNPIYVAYRVFQSTGYDPDVNGRIKFPIIKCDDLGRSYTVKSGSYGYELAHSVDEALSQATYLVQLQMGAEDIDHPESAFKIRGIRDKKVGSGKFIVSYTKRGGRGGFAIDSKEFDSHDAALEFAKKQYPDQNAEQLEKAIYEPQVWAKPTRFKIVAINAATGEEHQLEGEYGSVEEAATAISYNHEDLNTKFNESLQKSRESKGETVNKRDKLYVAWYYENSKGTYGVWAKDKGFWMGAELLKGGFETSKEAREYMEAHRAEYESMLKDMARKRSEFVYFDGDASSRKGKDYRNGKDVGEEEYKVFGFRGVQFGNWANDRDRQAALNNAYDSFMNLAEVLGVSPAALSLNGELGLAFGARGSGSANAHYESNEVVINLTKTRGAGSLAHEWWHALDNYFARRGGIAHGFITASQIPGARPEVQRAFSELTKAIRQSDYGRRSVQKGDYWGSDWEMTARLFAEWVDRKIAEKGESDHFLVRGVDDATAESWMRMGYVFYKARMKDRGEVPMPYEEYKKTPEALAGFPYPTTEEIKSTFGPLMEKVFEVIEEKNEDGKTVLFSKEVSPLTTYHGTGAAFERFDLQFLGSGEGTYVYGPGIYVTDVDGIAKTYADVALGRRLAEVRDGIDRLEARLQEIRAGYPAKIEKHEAMAEQFAGTWSGDTHKKFAQIYREMLETGDYKYDPEAQQVKNAIDYKYEQLNHEGKRHLYTVQIPGDNGHNYLPYGEEIPHEDAMKIKAALRARLLSDPNSGYTAKIADILDDELNQAFSYMGGETILGTLDAYLGNDGVGLKSTRFLHDLGYTGIKVPTNYGDPHGDHSANNYVVFDPKDARIMEHVRYSKLNQWPAEDKEQSRIRFSKVTDQKLLDELEKGETEVGYRNVVMKPDGTLGSPMADKLGKKGQKSVRTTPFAFNEWEQAEENPDMATDDGKINLIKPDGLGSVESVDYNPYIHIRPSKINKQFTQAWKRDNLVFVETLYPASELKGEYHAEKAALSVGKHEWTNGDLILSRWDKPLRIVPWEEVADEWVEEFKDRGVTFDIVPPGLLPVLAERGVEILPPKIAAGAPALRAYNEWRDNNPSGPGRGRNRSAVSSEQDAEYMAAVQAGDMEKAQKMVDEAAEIAFKNSKVRGEDGHLMKVYHGTGSNFNVFERPDFIYENGLGNGFYFTDDPKAAALYTMPGFYDNAAKIDDTMIDVLVNEFNVDSDDAVEAVREGYTDIPHYDEAYDRAVEKLFPNPHVISAYINIERPFVYDEDTNLEGWEVSEKMDQDNLDGVIEKGYAKRYPDLFDRIEEDKRPSANFGQYMVRNSSQIKSAEPVTYDDAGNIVPLSRRFNRERKDIRFSKTNENERIFISNAEDAVNAIGMEKATPEQWLKMIEGKGGLKVGEDKWIGLSDWLKASDKKTLNKQEVLDYIAKNRIQIEEQGYSEGKGLEEQIDRKYPGFSSAFGIDNTYEAGEIWLKDLHKARELYERVTGENADDLFESDLDDFAMELAQDVRTDRAINGTRLSYTTAGLHNKREIALTVPTIESWNQGDEIHFGDAGNGRAIAWIRFGDTVSSGEGERELIILKKELGKKYNISPLSYRLIEVASDEDKARIVAAKEKQNEDYRNGIFGKKVLVIDEIQSKRHQEARDKGGYKDSARLKEIKSRLAEIDRRKKAIKQRLNEIDQLVPDDVKGVVARRSYIIHLPEFDEDLQLHNEFNVIVAEQNRLINESLSIDTGIPAAPFEKNWHELAMKRMLRLAAEEGYDYVAWTTGDQQAERYNIGEVVQRINATDWGGEDMYVSDSGSKAVELYLRDKNKSIRFWVDKDGNIGKSILNAENFVGKPLRDVIGKNLSDRILADGSVNIDGDGLRVGNQGMSGFYDDILPRFMNKYGKKWGVKVEDIELPETHDEVGHPLKMHSVPVTEEMKRSVMRGQVMFSKTNRTESIFISNAEQAAERIKMDKATPEQWLKMLEKEGGLKAGEDKWIGLSDFIKSSDRKTLTKQEILDYIRDNQITIEETHYGSYSKEIEEALQKYQDELDSYKIDLDEAYEQADREVEEFYLEMNEKYGENFEYEMTADEERIERMLLDKRQEIADPDNDANEIALLEMVRKYGDDFESAFSVDKTGHLIIEQDYDGEMTGQAKYFLGEVGMPGSPINDVRLGYTTDGLENKHEIALTVPSIEPYNESDHIHFGDADGGRAIAWIRFGDAQTDDKRVLFIDEIQSKRHQDARDLGYKNVDLARKMGRLNELGRKMYGPNGMPRDEYAEYKQLQKEVGRVKAEYDEVAEEMKAKYGDGVMGQAEYWDEVTPEDKERILAVRDALRAQERGMRGVEPAPFEKNWHELAFKRMLRYAAEEGYDVVAWTLGEQQAERYDIGKVIDSIDVTPLEKTEFGSNGKGVKVEINYKNNVRPDTPFEFDKNGNGTLTDKNLEDYVGKDLAARILSMDRPGTISGDNLRVGAEGMKGFYDDIIPRFANKYGKKWGASTKDILVSLSNGLYLDAHSIEVTPSMKESVMRGQVMFSKEKRETGPFGTILRGYEGKAKEAIQKLMELREGEAIGAISHPEIGAIDLVWGNEGTGHSDGYGLAKLVKYHPEVVDKLQEIINDMHIVSKSENRINLESEKYRAAVRLTWDDQRKTWLLTVFEKKNSALDNTTDTGETSNGSERNDTATPQNTVSESKGSDNSGTSKSSGQKPLFSKLSRDVEDIVNDGKMRVSSENDEARAHLNERMMSIDKNLAKLRMAASAQREYDRETVRSITDLAKRLLDEGALSDPTRQEIEKMLTVTRWATGRKDLDGAVNAIMDLMVGNQLRHAKGVFDGLLKIRGSKVDARGVEVQGKLDAPGQRMMQVFKDAMDMAPEAIEDHIAAAEERLDSPDDAVKAAAGDELVGLRMAREYAEDIRASIDEEKGIKNELRQAAEDRRAGRMSLASYREFVASCDEALRQNRVDRINAYNSLTGRLSGKLYESIARGTAFRDEEKQRIERIHHFANSDLAGQKSDEHGNKNDRLTNNGIFRFLLKPLATFDQMLRHFGSKSVNGEGYLWNHFMRGWVDANDAEFQGMKAATDVLDRKVSDVFGRKMRWSDLYSVERKMPTVNVKFWDGGKMQDHELTQGNLLYIYMVNKMSDGRMKLRRMGIEEEHVNAIKEQMDPRFIELADWLQGEFLVNLRNKYNRVHEKLFGAPMAAIENYFPLKVLANARVREVDMATPDLDGTTPATITGSIIKRRKNALALDVIGTDAFSLVIEHLQQMEHWAAFAPFNQDLNTLLSYKTFRNRVQNMSGIYGAGSIIWENFRKSAEIAAGVYHPSVSRDSIDTAAVNIAKGVTAAKISFRVYTAIKQLLSLPAFISDANVGQLLKSMATPWKSWNWALKDLPGFQKRWLSRQAGDTRLMKTESDWKMWRNDMVKTASRLGMSPNAFVDALTVAVGAKAMYETRMKRYLKDGYTREQAEKRAKQDATILFNETQQSNENAFLSAMQLDRTWASVALTVFRNSSMGYQRQLVDAVRNLGRKLRPDYKDEAVEFMSKQMVRDGVDEQDARDAAERNYRKSTFRDALRVALFGFVMQFAWNLGKYLPYLIAGDDDDEKKKMLKDAALHGLLGGTVEGLSGGSVISEAANLLASGEGLKNYDPSLMPVASDIQRIIKMASYDQVAAANEVVNLLVQAGVGVNPQTLTDIGVAIYDACNGDLETSKEATLLLMRVLQCPQSQVDKVYIDELDLTAEKGLDLSIADFARRYAEYKVRRNATTLGWAYSDEAREKRINTYEKRFTKQAQELIRTRGSDLDRAYYEYVDTEHKEVDATLRDLRSGIRTSAQSGDQMGAMEYAQMLNDFMQTPEFQRYSKAHGNINAIKRLQTALKSADGNSRDAIEDQILQLKKQMVDELKRTDNK